MGERWIAQGGEIGARNCQGLGAARNKWGSIRIMLDDGWGEMADERAGVLTLHKQTSARALAQTHPLSDTHGRASTNRDPGRAVTQSHHLTPAKSISVGLTLSPLRAPIFKSLPTS